MATRSKSKTTVPRSKRHIPPVPAACDALMSKRQVMAALGGVSRSHLEKMIARGEFPRHDVNLGEQLARWRASTVNEWIEERCRGRSVEEETG